MLQTAVSSVLDGNFIVVDAGEVLVKPAPTEVDIFFIEKTNSSDGVTADFVTDDGR